MERLSTRLGQCQVWKHWTNKPGQCQVWDTFHVFYGYHCYQKWDRGLEFSYLKHNDCQVSGNRLVCIVACDSATVLANISLRTRFGEHRRVPFLVAMIAAKDIKCVSFPNLAMSTPLALMNVLVTINARLLCLTHSPIDSSSFLFLPLFAYYYIMQYDLLTFLCLHFVLMKSIWLASILSRDVFVF